MVSRESDKLAKYANSVINFFPDQKSEEASGKNRAEPIPVVMLERRSVRVGCGKPATGTSVVNRGTLCFLHRSRRR